MCICVLVIGRSCSFLLSPESLSLSLSVLTVYPTGNVDYLKTRLAAMMNEVMQGWGLLRMDGSSRPALAALQQAFASV